MATVLSHQDARRAYDRIGSLQDSQAFYEDRATNVLLRHGEFGSAEALFEFGCGTGRFALRLFKEFLSPNARYRGVDISPKMVSLAEARLAPFSSRAEVILSEGGAPIDQPPESCDRFVSNYVFDLLAEEDTRGVLREAHRMLRPGGLLCLTGLSTGVGPLSRGVARAWGWLQAHRPSAVGGCRPIDLLPLLAASAWQVRHHAKVVAFGVTSEVLVGERR
jgi:ubiquinone/menaquinone biosynthesis C-methylase UbiE